MKYFLSLSLSFFLLCNFAFAAEDKKTEDKKQVQLQEVVVTAPVMEEPVTVKTDPKSPRQPVPAADGAGYLKNIPGFSVTRKGGTSGDPVFRGFGGTRLNILLDGSYIQGGCGGRMDPPTAYVYPESYDSITVLKGPQTVLYGGGNVSGTVLYERKTKAFDSPGVRGALSSTVGSFGRNDQMVDLTGGVSRGFLRLIGTRADSDDYRDGDGHKVHSFYERRSLTGIAGWLPDEHTRVEFSADVSDAKSAFADRTMDGVKFDRNGYSLNFERSHISSLINKVELKAYYNYIDHVMDNFSLRPRSGMAMLSNPDRTTEGGRLDVKLALTQTAMATLGIDYQENVHTLRSGTNYASKARTPDMTFKNTGLFFELEKELTPKNRIIGGLRTDLLDVQNDKPGSIASDSDTTYGTFLRYEHDYASAPVTSYVGIGMSQRPADWWERNQVFRLKPERNVQMDAGVIYHANDIKTSLSLFYAKIRDFIQLSSTAPTARNIKATTYGGEADFSYVLHKYWTAGATVAYTRGENDTYDRPLAQMPPLEGTLGLKFDNKTFLAGVLFRAVATQDRFDAGKGTTIGTDIGKTPGFAVVSANAGYRPIKDFLVTAGVDNIFDKTYAEHISKAVSSSVAGFGYVQTVRVNEPGRTLWVKANYSF